MGMKRIIFPQQLDNPMLQLFARDRRRIAVLDFEAIGEHVAHERKGKPSGLAIGPAIKNADGVRTKLDPFLELTEQTGFSQTGLASDSNDLRILFVNDGLEG